MPPLSIAPIINGLKESIEHPHNTELLKNSFRRIMEALEEVEQVYNTNYNNPQNLDFGLLTHRIERSEDLANSLRLIAGSGITLTKALGQRTMAVAATAGARPVYEDEFPPTIVDDTDAAALVTRLYSTWRWFEHVTDAGNIGSATSSSGYPGNFITQVNAAGSRILRPIFISAPNWFLASELFDSYFTLYAQWSGLESDFRIGYNGTSGTIIPPANGIYFEKLRTDTNWFGVTRAGGAQTRIDTTVAANNAFEGWELFRVRRIDASTIGFTVGAAAEVTQTLTIPTTNLDPCIIQVTGAGGTSTTLTFDLWRIFFTGLGAKRPPA